MSKERFERLRQSIIEAGQVMRGEIEPSREFTYERVVCPAHWFVPVQLAPGEFVKKNDFQ